MTTNEQLVDPGALASDEARTLLEPWVIFTAGDGERSMRVLDRTELVQLLLDHPALLVRLAVEAGALQQIGHGHPVGDGSTWNVHPTGFECQTDPNVPIYALGARLAGVEYPDATVRRVRQSQATTKVEGREYPCQYCSNIYETPAGLGGHVSQHRRQGEKT